MTGGRDQDQHGEADRGCFCLCLVFHPADQQARLGTGQATRTGRTYPVPIRVCGPCVDLLTPANEGAPQP